MLNSKTDEYYQDALYELYQDRLEEHKEMYNEELDNWTKNADMVINPDCVDSDGKVGQHYINTEIEAGRSEGLWLDVYNGNIEYWTDVMEETGNPHILEYVAKLFGGEEYVNPYETEEYTTKRDAYLNLYNKTYRECDWWIEEYPKPIYIEYYTFEEFLKIYERRNKRLKKKRGPF